MPFLEYQCPKGHVTERFFKTIVEGGLTDSILCEACMKDDGEENVANKIFSRPLGFGLYGNPDGYYKPSATKRFTTKTVSKKEGNASSAG